MTHLVDARGSRCPAPILELGRIARDLGHVGRVELLADDPATRTDVPAWCRMRHARLVSVEEMGDGAWRYVVELGSG